MRHYKQITALLLTTAFIAVVSPAQNHPAGRWQKVNLSPAGHTLKNTRDFGFRDSLNGLSISDKGEICFTTDGGRTWTEPTSIAQTIGAKATLNSVECTGPARGFYFDEWNTVSVSRNSATLLSVPKANEPNFGSYLPLAEKMYDSAYGFRVVELVSPQSAQSYQDSVIILVTHDGWNSSTWYGQGYQIVPQPGNNRVMGIGKIVDSNDIWMTLGSVQSASVILHTSNGGANWDKILAIDTNMFKPYYKDILVDRDAHAVFVVGSPTAATKGKGNDKIDFVYSQDYGLTWHPDTTFGVALWRMQNPGPGILWATISEGGIANTEIIPYADASLPIHKNQYSSKMAYSENGGMTWDIDSVTFLNDSLEDLHFVDPRHGWVASWSHDSVFVWKYEASALSNVLGSEISEPTLPSPNPATTNILFPHASATCSIVDAIGRSWDCPRQGDRFEISVLPAGIYYLADQNRRFRFLKQ